MAKREFLMLAHKYDATKYQVGGWWASEKLDGQRCFWDGGISRDKAKTTIPWANTKKDGRYKEEQICTGLWTRYGNVIHAPDEWLDGLTPGICLDGELWMGDYSQGSRQTLRSIVSRLQGSHYLWKDVCLNVFDAPSHDQVLFDGEIKNTNMKVKIEDVLPWAGLHGYMGLFMNADWPRALDARYNRLRYLWEEKASWVLHEQEELPHATQEAQEVIERMLHKVLDKGGEGLILRNPYSTWEPCRSHRLLKVKPFDDMEGEVVGYITGRKTDLGSKLLGKMGTLVLKLDNGIRLELSGFTDEERELTAVDPKDHEKALAWAVSNPEEYCPDWIVNKNFRIGDRVTFKYRGRSKEGVPQEARYWRKR